MCTFSLGRIAVAAPKEYNPRYEDDFVAGRDYDPDRQRANVRKMQRQMVKEKRGAVRELRKDASFMAQVRGWGGGERVGRRKERGGWRRGGKAGRLAIVGSAAGGVSLHSWGKKLLREG
jgi:hypothetical protein